MRRRLAWLLCSVLAADALLANAQSNNTPANLRNVDQITTQPSVFQSAAQISEWFEKAKIPVEPKEFNASIAGKSINLLVVQAYPYSGVSNIDVYLYESGAAGYVLLFLYKVPLPRTRLLQVVTKDSYVILLDGDEEVLRAKL